MKDSKILDRFSLMDSEKVAKKGYQAMMQGKNFYIPGLLNKIMAFSIRFTPRNMAAAITGKVQESK